MIPTQFIKMDYNNILFFICSIFLCLPSTHAQEKQFNSTKAQKYAESGNAAYKNNDYNKAKDEYAKALLTEKNNGTTLYNMGNATYYSEEYDASAKAYENAIPTLKQNTQQAQAYYNLGNSMAQQNKWKEAANAYKNALKLNPNDTDAKYNLSYALKKLKQQQANDNKKDNNDKQNDKQQDKQQDKQEDKNEDKPNKENKDNQNDPDNKQQNPNQPEKEEPQNQTPTPSKFNKQQAENILNALRQEEKKLQDQKNKKGNTLKVFQNEKDW